jgi:hypothetical protein
VRVGSDNLKHRPRRDHAQPCLSLNYADTTQASFDNPFCPCRRGIDTGNLLPCGKGARVAGICGWTSPQQASTFRTLAPSRKLSLYRIAHAIQSTRLATGGDLGRYSVFTASPRHIATDVETFPPSPAMREEICSWRALRRVTADISDKRAILHTRYFNPPPHVTLISERPRLPQHCVFRRASIASSAHDQYTASLKCLSTKRLQPEILPLARFFREVIEKDLCHEPLQNLWMVDIARVAIQRPSPCVGP